MCPRPLLGAARPRSRIQSRKLCHSERSVPKVLSSEIGLAISVGTRSRGISLRFLNPAQGIFPSAAYILSGASIPSRASAVTNCRSALRLTRAAEFVSDNAPKHALEGLLCPSNVLPESSVNQALVIPASSTVHLFKKPFENVLIKSNRDSLLSFRHRNHGATFRSAEVVFTSCRLAHIAASRVGWPDALKSRE